MALVHVYPNNDTKRHLTNGRCWCEPEILDVGKDDADNPARVFIHVPRTKLNWFWKGE